MVKEIVEPEEYESMRALKAESYVAKLTERDRKRFELSKLEQNVKKLVKKNIKLKWSKENAEVLGRAAVDVEGKKFWLDNSFDTRFERMKDKLAFQPAKILFSD